LKRLDGLHPDLVAVVERVAELDLGVVLIVAGLITKVAASLGYSRSRAIVKAAAAQGAKLLVLVALFGAVPVFADDPPADPTAANSDPGAIIADAVANSYPDAQRFGGCFRGGSICLAPSVSLSLVAYDVDREQFVAGFNPGIGYGITFWRTAGTAWASRPTPRSRCARGRWTPRRCRRLCRSPSTCAWCTGTRSSARATASELALEVPAPRGRSRLRKLARGEAVPAECLPALPNHAKSRGLVRGSKRQNPRKSTDLFGMAFNQEGHRVDPGRVHQ
jgi:hypothetical protein